MALSQQNIVKHYFKLPGRVGHNARLLSNIYYGFFTNITVRLAYLITRGAFYGTVEVFFKFLVFNEQIYNANYHSGVDRLQPP